MRQLDDIQARFNAAANRLLKTDEVAQDGPVGLAVSGGSDSLALLHCAAKWSARTEHSLLALTVDHGLRPEAALEARQVASQCARLGIGHQTLVWNSPEKTQAAARRARHALMAEALRAAGGTYLMTGHTADDQAETFLIRVRAGSGWYGLAGMGEISVSPVWPEGRGISLVRPLLHCRRQELRALLQLSGWDWANDPSNEDMAYERVRVRHMLSVRPDLFEQITRIQAKFVTLRRAGDELLAVWLSTAVTVSGHGLISADMGTLPDSLHSRALSLLIQSASGTEYPPDRAGLARLARQIRNNAPMPGQTLGGAWLRRQKGKLLIARDPGSSGQVGMTGHIWDGRFSVTGDHMAEQTVRPHPMVRASLPSKGIIKTCLIEGRLLAFAEVLGGL